MTEQVFQRPSPLSNNDTLLVTLFIAAVIHTLLILGINFNKPKADKSSKSIEITLVTREAKKAPKKAEFLAQNNQIGAGEKRDKVNPAASKSRSAATKQEKPPGQKSSRQQKIVHKQVITRNQSEQKIQNTKQIKNPEEATRPKLSMDALRQQLNQLGEKIRYQKPSSDQKRIKFINSVSTHKYLAAQYITDWQRKIESMGNLNYPAIAKRPGFSSTLTMDVGIKPNGSIYSIRISKSSGYPALDQAAKRIVKLSAPFPPLPKALLQEVDVLVITRVWKFSDESGLYTR
ncbi:MAG: energy transducer TonB [Gammaproteobacteria bacterium]|jgi:periplasmic protein TonB|nr:energy transducer TonB [Gammaproteobacteria bacterium]MBT5221475.1 energy transducer TonB [Gammaproteobacteria bacterium]MBT5825090.1 energy transducer TonB [Gammaproteobacteria bacterium]MBT5966539.1 energy transducer TonB [Gammaproteobacteria bacterium]MBT6419691.1 energy transducer TonB [Gammaproteobacteria bacterium]